MKYLETGAGSLEEMSQRGQRGSGQPGDQDKSPQGDITILRGSPHNSLDMLTL